ncbi:MAG: putative sugar nucleotidyl transferase, partial [Phycisphaerae bacterium]
NMVLFEDAGYRGLLPLTYWRTVFGLRCGRKTLMDRAAMQLNCAVSGLWTRDWQAAVSAERFLVPVNQPVEAGAVLVNGRWLAQGPVEFAPGPFVGTSGGQIAYISCDAALASRIGPQDLLDVERARTLLESVAHGEVAAKLIDRPWDLISSNAQALKADWQPDDRGREGKVSSSALMLEPDHIFIGPDAEVEPTAVMDATGGPIYVSQGARIRPHAYVEGPAYIGPGSVVHPHSHIRGGTTLGPMCKVGGEIDACIFAGYSNKQHHGFLGHAYVGSWVNLGAGTVNSDLKNTYGPVRAALPDGEIDTGAIFYGAVIADHVKTGIQQNIPTGASIGFGAMAAVGRVLPKFVPSFSWMTEAGHSQGDPERLLSTARKMMERRDVTCSEATTELFREIARRAPAYESRTPN